PEIGKLRDLRPTFVDIPCFISLHLLKEPGDLGTLLFPGYRSSSGFVGGTTFFFESTGLAVSEVRSIRVTHVWPIDLFTNVSQRASRWANESVSSSVIDEGLCKKFLADFATGFQTSSFGLVVGHRSYHLYLLFFHHHYIGGAYICPINHNLFRQRASVLLYLVDRGSQFAD